MNEHVHVDLEGRLIYENGPQYEVIAPWPILTAKGVAYSPATSLWTCDAVANAEGTAWFHRIPMRVRRLLDQYAGVRLQLIRWCSLGEPYMLMAERNHGLTMAAIYHQDQLCSPDQVPVVTYGETDPNDWPNLLSRLGLPVRKATLRILARYGGSATLVSRLTNRLSCEKIIKLLSHCTEGRITDDTALLIGQMNAQDLTVRLIEMSMIDDPDLGNRLVHEYVHRVKEWCSQIGITGRPWCHVRDYAGLCRLYDRMYNRFMVHRTDNQKFPAPDARGGTTGTYQIEHIASPRELLHEGQRMKNCVFGEYLDKIQSGRFAAYRMVRPQRCTIVLASKKQVERFGNNEDTEDPSVRILEDVRAVCNRQPSSEAMNALLAWLEVELDEIMR